MTKRKADDMKTALSLEQALKMVEKLKKPVTLKTATSMLKKLGNVRPAKVVMASKISKQVLDFESTEEEDSAPLSEVEEEETLEELRELDYRKCCRGSAMGKQLSSSRILAVCRPVMEAVPNPRRLSEVSKVLEIMLTYTQVGLDSSVTEWDEFEEWVEAKLFKIPLFAQITDPTFLFIRGQNGTPPPAGIAAVVQAIPHAGHQNDGNYSQQPIVSVRRAAPAAVGGGVPPVQAPIPNLYQFADRVDAGIARAAVLGWAAGNGHTLDFARISSPNGIIFM